MDRSPIPASPLFPEFNYRNHGADYGRVLCGIQVPGDQRKLLKSFLDKLGYEWSDESDNEAYKLFLG